MTNTRAKRMLGGLLCTSGVVVALGSVMLGTTPTLAAAGVVVLAVGAAYAIRHPAVLLVTLVVVEVTNLSGVTQLPLISALVGLGLLTVGLSLRDRAMLQRLNRWTAWGVVLVGFYLATQASAVLGSQDIGASTARLTELVLDCAFLLLVLCLVQLTRRPWLVASSFVVSLAALSFLSIVNELVFDGAQTFGGFSTVTKATAELITTPRYAGPLQDSNFWGRQLILALPLAGALTVRALRSQRRTAALGWIAAALALLGGTYLTQSRGTMIASAVVIIVWVVASGPVARRVGLKSLPLMALVLAAPGIGDRLVILVTDVFTPGHKYGVDLSVLQRAASQEMAWAMFLDRPLFGIGPNAFQSMIATYAGRAETAVLNPTNAPHNLYAQLAAESGIVGLVGWTVLLASVICLLALRVPRISPIRAMADRSLAAATLAALIGWSFASVFLHMAYFRTFAIIIALAVALSFSREGESIPLVPQQPGLIRQIAVSTMLAAASASALLAVSGTPTYVASTTVTLLPTEPVTGRYAYALDVRSRDVVIPTYAALIAANAPKTTAAPDAVRGAITLSVADADSRSARAGLDIAWATAHRNLEILNLDHMYTISQISSIKNEYRVIQTPASAVAALLLAVVTWIVAMVLMRRISTRRSRGAPMSRPTPMSEQYALSDPHVRRRQNDDLSKRP